MQKKKKINIKRILHNIPNLYDGLNSLLTLLKILLNETICTETGLKK